MKLKICFLGLLCLYSTGWAQDNRALSAQPKIGELVPDVTLSNLHHYKLNGKPVSSAKLSAFHGRLLIIDFWAAWCSPCRAMIPRMDSLQQQFNGRVQFLPVTYQSYAEVLPVLQALENRSHPLPLVSSDKVLHRLFPHYALPHYVWIDASGRLRAITEYGAVNAKAIQRLLDSGELNNLAQKMDQRIPYQPALPLFVNGNGGDGSGLIYHSMLSHYVPGLPAGMHISAADSSGQRITVRNSPLLWLYKTAFSYGRGWFNDARTRLLTRDSDRLRTGLSGQAYLNWLSEGHGWNYELKVPAAMAGNTCKLMQADLERLFPQYIAGLEGLNVPCLALIRTSGEDKIKSRGGARKVTLEPFQAVLRHAALRELTDRLDRQYLQNSRLPVVDATGYREAVDIELHGDLSSLTALNLALKAYDLQLVPRRQAVSLLVIRDRPTLPNPFNQP